MRRQNVTSVIRQSNEAVEFRILTGSQSGCRLTLKSGTYRAGADHDCDLLIEGAAAGAPAFILFIGHRGVALEGVAEDIKIQGQVLHGFASLELGQVFSLASADFCITEPNAPSPNDEEIAAARLPRLEAQAPDHPPPLTAPIELPDETLAPPVEPEHPTAPPIAPVRSPKKRLPFWAVWLGSTAMFLAAGLAVLIASLQPSDAAAIRQPEDAGTALQRLIANAKPYSKLNLSRRSDGSWQVSGNIATRKQLADFVASVRMTDADTQIRIAVDEDMEALAKETLHRFADLDVTLTRVKFGEITLDGNVRRAAQRDQLCRALFNDVPGLTNIHSEVSADDDIPVTLNELLVSEGLSSHIRGRFDDSQLIVTGFLPKEKATNWRTVRSTLEKRFGPKLSIVEKFSETASAQGRPVLSVLGAVPYVLLDTGEMEGRGHKEERP